VQNFAFKFQAVAEKTAKIVRGLLYFAAPCTTPSFKYQLVSSTSLQCSDTVVWVTGRASIKSWLSASWWWRCDWSFVRHTAPVVTTTSIILGSNKSRMETFWYQLTQVHLEKWQLKWKDSFFKLQKI